MKIYLNQLCILFILNINLTLQFTFDQCCNIRVQDQQADTCNGPLQGQCYEIPISFSNSSSLKTNVLSFKSIPFAEKPIGNRRFQDPAPIKNWHEIKNATIYPKACVQDQQSVETSEDCLYLNVFVQQNTFNNKNKELKPVLIFIHGGGFTAGSSKEYDQSFVVATNDIVAVTIQYRLDIFGFLHLNDSDALGNQGFLDQTLALKWIYENIQNFGGDNKKITISGESAGSWSVGYHLFNKESWPYFRNAIMQSGGPTGRQNLIRLATKDDANAQTIKFAKDVNCSRLTNEETLRCLKQLDAQTLLNQITKSNYKTVLIKGSKNFAKEVEELAAENAFKKCNILSGYTSDEMGFFLAFFLSDTEMKNLNFEKFEESLIVIWKNFWQIYRFKEVPIDLDLMYERYFGTLRPQDLDQTKINYADKLIQILSDPSFVCQSFQLAEVFSKAGQKVYVYEFKFRNIASSFDSIYGQTVHAEDLVFTLGIPLSEEKFDEFLYTPREKLVTEIILNYWINFIKYDDPNFEKKKEDLIWNPHAENSNSMNGLTASEKTKIGRYLLLGARNEMKIGFSSHQCDAWEFITD